MQKIYSLYIQILSWYLNTHATKRIFERIEQLYSIYVVRMFWVCNSFHGGLEHLQISWRLRTFANFMAVLHVNNSLSGRVAVLLLGLTTHYRES